MAQDKKEIMIITGEASGDLHGANLVRAMLRQRDDLQFYGMGGPELCSLEFENLYDAQKVAVVGLVEVISHLPSIFEAKKCLTDKLKESRPALLIIIDLPDFNLMIAKVAKKLGIPVFYYITPQVWAWRTGRVKTLKERVNRLGVILPFEEVFFKKHGIEAEYVGHPLLDHVKKEVSREQFCIKYDISQDSKLAGLIPGSRSKEISSLLPDLLRSARKLQAVREEKITFLLPVAPTIEMAELKENGIEEFGNDLEIRIITENRYDVMGNCDAAVAASGTVTLELAVLGVPMVVVYRISPLTYWLGRQLVKVPFFSLVNLIAENEVVPELLQDEVNPERISSELEQMLFTDKREDVVAGLARVNKLLGSEGASERAAAVALQML